MKTTQNTAKHCRICFVGVPRWVLEAAAGWAGWPGGWPASQKIYKVGKTAENAPLKRGFPRFPKKVMTHPDLYYDSSRRHLQQCPWQGLFVTLGFFGVGLGGSNGTFPEFCLLQRACRLLLEQGKHCPKLGFWEAVLQQSV